MVELKKTLYGYDSDGKEVYYVELAAKSGETLPTAGIVSGSKCIEVDTGKEYVFDGISTTKKWNERVLATKEVA